MRERSAADRKRGPPRLTRSSEFQQVDALAASDAVSARLKLGLTPWQRDLHQSAGGELGAQVARAEELEFHSFFVPESHFFDGALPAPLTLLAYAAGKTERIKLGTTSLLLPVRHAVRLAEEIATLDRVCDGRLILGLGRGFRRALFEVFDVDPANKRELLEESLSRMRAAWAGTSLRGQGPEIGPGGPPARLTESRDPSKGPRLFPRPLQDPHPPLWMAAFGPKALRQAARLAMPYLASPLESEDQLATNYELLDTESRRLGQEVMSTRPAMRTVIVHDDPDVRSRALVGLEAEQEAWRASRSKPLQRALEEPLAQRVIIGCRAEVSERISALRERLGMTHLIARCQAPDMSEQEKLQAVENLAALQTEWS